MNVYRLGISATIVAVGQSTTVQAYATEPAPARFSVIEASGAQITEVDLPQGICPMPVSTELATLLGSKPEFDVESESHSASSVACMTE